MKTCLVVDDSSVIRKVARRILEGLSFEITEAEDGEQALGECQRKLPDAVLLDWNMPKMDGYEFLRALRRLPEDGREENPVNLDPRMAKLAGGVHRLDGQLMVVLDVDRVLELAPKPALAA